MKSGNLNFLVPSGPLQACNGTALPLLLCQWSRYVTLGVTFKNSVFLTEEVWVQSQRNPFGICGRLALGKILRCVLLVFLVCIGAFTLDTGLLAISQYSEGPATGHLDTGFSWFPCVF